MKKFLGDLKIIRAGSIGHFTRTHTTSTKCKPVKIISGAVALFEQSICKT